MKRWIFWSVGITLTCWVFCSHAMAQTGGGGTQPALTWPVAIVTTLSVLAGFITQSVQSGSILGIAVLPKPWLPEITLFGSFLGGVVAYLASLGSTTALNATTIYGAVMAGITALIAGASPGLARHAHFVVPAKVVQLRAATQNAVKAAVFILALGAIAGTQTSCAPAVGPVSCIADITIDALKGWGLPQILQDVGLQCAATLDELVNVLIGSTDPKVQATPAYREAMTRRAASANGDGGAK